MAIQVLCPGCAKNLKAPAEMAGKQARCPHCRTCVQVPLAPVEEEAGYALSEPPAPRPSFVNLEPPRSREALVDSPHAERAPAKKPAASRDDATFYSQDAASSEMSGSAPPSRRQKTRHIWFALTLVPLAFSLLSSKEDFTERVERTIEAHPEVIAKMESAKTADSDIFALLPNARLEGAHLSRHTWVHWLYALAAAALFYALIMTLFERGEASSSRILIVGGITATAGIFMLLLFQWVADWTQNFWVRGRSIIVLLFYVVKLIGFSYRAALDPENGFLLSFLGFTLGVGLCEEFTKAAPVYFRLRENGGRMSWRAASVWGLASGAGFGIAEGILYASDYYNGIATFGIYPVRFISCVGLHAIWTASVALMIWHNQELLSDEMDWGDWILALLKVQGVPMVLHGLYDTLLKREMNAAALVTALASFAWLAFLMSRSFASDQPPKKRVRSAASLT